MRVRQLTYATVFVSLVFLGQGLLATAAWSEPAEEVSESGLTEAEDDLPVLETMVVGFRLEGERRTEFVQIGDLDILWRSEAERLLPFLRLCKELEIPLIEDQAMIRLRNPGGDSVVIDLFMRQAKLNGEFSPVSFQIGRSDITGVREIYVPDSLLASWLSLTLEWDDSGFQYLAKSAGPVPKLVRLRAEKASRSRRERPSDDDLALQGVALPEIAPPATPQHFGDPSLGTIQPGLRVSGTTAGNLLVQRSLSMWGRLMRGEYSARLRQSELELRSFTRLDQAYWYRRFGDVEMNLGDVIFGLNELVFPSTSIAGVEMNGLLGAGEDGHKKARSQRGRYNNFGTRLDFRGHAPLGSTVYLYRGDRLISEQKIVETDGAPLGEGVYHFRAVNLLRDVRNEVRIVVVEQDSTIHEYTREIIGTDRLLGPGQVAFIGGAGTRRLPDEEFWFTQGHFVGGRLSVGLLPSMTLGPVAAWQQDYAFTSRIEAVIDSERSERMQMPRESHHAGMEWAWRLFDRVVISAMGAGSRATEDSVVRYAGRASLLFPLGPFRLHPQVFAYEPSYFNGANTWLEDRAGYAASLLWPFMRNSRLTLASGQVEDNINRTEQVKTVLAWQRADLSLPRISRRTELTLTAERFAPRHSDAYLLWTVTGAVGLPLRFRLYGQTTWGDEFGRDDGRGLIEDLGITDAPRQRRAGWELNLNRRLLESGDLTLTHSDFPYRKRTYLTHILQARGKSHFQWRLQGGYDWKPESPFGQAQLSYNLDRSGTGSVGVLARLQRNEWVFGVTLSLRPTFGLLGGKPFLMTRSQLNPQIGGLRGQVFLDRNGNGLPEAGEPGIGGMEILTDSGERIKTSKRGAFVLQPRGEHHEVHVRLNPSTVPAFYAATNGAQWAEIEEGSLTRVGLGLIILNSVSGSVTGPDPFDTTRMVGMNMVRVVARSATGEIVQESITAGDGSYYLGELKSGEYQIDVDGQTLLPGYRVDERREPLTLQPTNEPLDLENINIRCSYEPPPEEKDTEQKKEVPEEKIEYKKF